MKVASIELRDKADEIEKDILFPDFYHEFADYLGFELTQAQFFIDRAHYSRNDQFLCAIDGGIHVRLVPHVNR